MTYVRGRRRDVLMECLELFVFMGASLLIACAILAVFFVIIVAMLVFFASRGLFG